MLKFNKFPPEKPGDVVWSFAGLKIIERITKDAYPPKGHTPSLEQMHHTSLHLGHIRSFASQLVADSMSGQSQNAIKAVDDVLQNQCLSSQRLRRPT